MADEQKTTELIEEELVAYLDGELDAQSAQLVEDRISNDPDYRSKLQTLETSWDLLEELPRAELDEKLAQTTIGMVAMKAADDIEKATTQVQRRAIGKWIGVLFFAVLFGFLGFKTYSDFLDRDNQQLLQDLTVIERVDMYRNIEDFDFLMKLAEDDLFGGEAENENLE